MHQGRWQRDDGADDACTRRAAGAALAEQAASIGDACRAMAARFYAGGKLVTLATGPSRSDAHHVAVEFIHPVVVGKRSLPALALPCEGTAPSTALAAAVPRFVRAGDIALGLTSGPAGEAGAVLDGLRSAKAIGALTVLLGGPSPADAEMGAFVDHLLLMPAVDPLVVQELEVTTYHALWELAHVFLEQPASLTVDRLVEAPTCITCSDAAVAVPVVELLGADLALVRTESGLEEVSVALVEADVGQVVLVHAKEAIGVVET